MVVVVVLGTGGFDRPAKSGGAVQAGAGSVVTTGHGCMPAGARAPMGWAEALLVTAGDCRRCRDRSTKDVDAEPGEQGERSDDGW